MHTSKFRPRSTKPKNLKEKKKKWLISKRKTDEKQNKKKHHLQKINPVQYRSLQKRKKEALENASNKKKI